MNKKVILSLSIIVAAAAVVIGATGAFFSDTETSTGNLFKAGSIDLKVDSEAHFNGMVCVPDGNSGYEWMPEPGTSVDSSHYPQPGMPCDGTWEETDLLDGVHTFFNFADLKPGDEGENTISLHVYDNDAWGWFTLRGLSDDDNTCTEPELEDEVNCTPDGEGELDDEVLFTIWLDQGTTPGFQNQVGQNPVDVYEGDNEWQQEEGPVLESGNVHEFDPFDLSLVLSAAYNAAQCSNNYDATGHNNYGECHGLAEDGRMVGSTTYYFGVKWELPIETGNIVQTDSFGGDMEFVVVQHRNNPTKLGGPEATQKVGANLAAYTAPGCTTTVTGGNSIQAAVNSANNGDTICVATDYTGVGDTYPLTINKLNLTLAGLGNAGDATLPGGTFIDANGVTFTGLTVDDYSWIQGSADAAIYIHNNISGVEVSYNKLIAPSGAKSAQAKGIITEIGGAGNPGASGLAIHHNLVQDWRQGMFFNTANYEVAFNDVYGNDVGVANDGPHSSSIHNNDFENNVIEAVGVAPSAINGTANNGVLAVNTNNLAPAGVGNDVNWYGSSVFSGADVDATGNWWNGEAAGVRTNNLTEVDVSSPEVSAYPEN